MRLFLVDKYYIGVVVFVQYFRGKFFEEKRKRERLKRLLLLGRFQRAERRYIYGMYKIK